MVAPAPRLDLAFQALAHPTRRSVVERLGVGPASVSDLAAPFDMALPSFMEHLRMLEASGLVTSEKRGRVRTVRLRPGGVLPALHWLNEQRGLWEDRLDRLEAYARTLEED